MSMSTYYYALTTLNTAHGFTIVGIGTDKQAVRETAERAICGAQWGTAKDVYVETRLKNLFVVTESVAKRRYASAYQRWLETPDAE